ncbi:hypothetical protein A4A49_15325 [Nicotiana attenuata]|uniref:Uncharacterized protein n=1 Tax=Nicotiana attenuata TaxID=49451 RepID=A0A314L566_NICAT|nr:hypothetical protein A4A49_15325 [Nicotiana attenuata]
MNLRSLPTDFVRLDQDILTPLAGKKQLYTYETMDFWEQIKTPGMSLKCSGLYLAQYRSTSPHLLASGDGSKTAAISGDDLSIHLLKFIQLQRLYSNTSTTKIF